MLRLENIEAGYGPTQVLFDVTLDVGADEICAVLGPNGSGKSTLLKTVMDLTSLYAGCVHWNGQDVTEASTWERARRGLCWVPQTENVFPSLTVRENLLLGAIESSRQESQRSLDLVFDLFPRLGRRTSIRAGSLSGGERRMLAIGTALMQDPELLILDEPTSDLAPAIIDVIFEQLKRVHDQLDVPILMVEQNVPRALEIADHVCVLVRGRKVADRERSDVDPEAIGALFMELKDG